MSVVEAGDVKKSKGKKTKKHVVSASVTHWLQCSCNCTLQNGCMADAVEWMSEHGGGPVPLTLVYEAVTDKPLGDSAEVNAARELLAMAGVDNLVDAVSNWDAERQAMRALHDQNAALRIWQRRFILVVGFMVQLLGIFEKEGSLFFPLKSQQLIASMRKQIAEMEVGLQKVKLILDEKV